EGYRRRRPVDWRDQHHAPRGEELEVDAEAVPAIAGAAEAANRQAARGPGAERGRAVPRSRTDARRGLRERPRAVSATTGKRCEDQSLERMPLHARHRDARSRAGDYAWMKTGVPSGTRRISTRRSAASACR